MVNQFGQWTPDYMGQTPYNDPAYMQYLHRQQAAQQAPAVNSFQNGTGSAPQTPQMVTPPVQNSAPISVRGEQQALDWPIAPGNSLTFIDESAGYVYTKTSLNQFDRPQFVKYRLVREDVQEAATAPATAPQAPEAPAPAYALQSDVEALRSEVMGEIEGFRARLDELPEKPAARGKKKEDDSDDGSVR